MNWKDGSSKIKKEKKEKFLREGKEGEDYITCKKCGIRLRQITKEHLRVCIHECKTIDDYKKIYLDAQVRCKNLIVGFKTISKEKRIENAIVAQIIGKEKDKNHLFKEYGDGSIPPFCQCGCRKEVTRSKLPPYGWNEYIAHHHQTDIKEIHEKWKNENPDKYKESMDKAHKNLSKRHQYLKENYPEEYSESQSNIAKEFHRKNPDFARNIAISNHKKYPDLGQRCYQARIENAPWYFMKIAFGSRQESDIAKLRFKILGIIPINGINCQIRINKKLFDFEQFGFVHEHHPEQQYESFEPKDGYYKERRKVLDENGHKNSELIVTTNVNEVRKMYRWLEKHLDIKENIIMEVV